MDELEKKIFKKIVLHNKLLSEEDLGFYLDDWMGAKLALDRMVSSNMFSQSTSDKVESVFDHKLKKEKIKRGIQEPESSTFELSVEDDIAAALNKVEATDWVEGEAETITSVSQSDVDDSQRISVSENSPSHPIKSASADPLGIIEKPSVSSANPNENKIDKLFRALEKHEGSDLHLGTGNPPMIRVHGTIEKLNMPAMTEAEVRLAMEQIMDDGLKQQFDDTGDIDWAYEIPGLARFRCNAYMDRKGPAGTFRIIPNDFLTMEQLKLPPSIYDLCSLNKGLVLVTGPTGSGKSTTLAAMIDYINRTRQDHIITIEDPIEFVHNNKKCLMNQRQVHTHTESFSRALKAALREDPDIVLVGEMRDLETTHIAIETAETGHLVFGTLHTTTAASTIDRIIDQFPADRQSQIRTMLASGLKGVISQTLCKRVPKGRIAALEILLVTSGVANHIRDGKTFHIPSAMQTGAKIGMQLLNDALLDLVKKKIVMPDEAILRAIDRRDMLDKIKNEGIAVGDEAESVLE